MAEPQTHDASAARNDALSIAVVPGDGIGPEVIAEARKVLDAALEGSAARVEYVEYPLGAGHWAATGETLTEETLESLRGHDAILFGAVGADPQDVAIPSGLIERELLLKLRFSLDHGVNLRPSRSYPGVVSPLSGGADVDFVVVREGTEGPYVGNGGTIRRGTEHEIATEVSLNTAHGVYRVVEDAFRRAAARRQKLTLVHKHNVLVHAGDLWRRATAETSARFPDVTWDYMHVDAATIYLVTDPQRFDVIVTDNLFGDILTDLAAAVTGGIGLASSGSINVSGTGPSMFEPVHGSAPDIAGQQIADPTAATLSAALMLRHLGLIEPAERIERVVESQLSEWASTGSGAGLSTAERGDAFAAKLRSQ
ncbi:MAG TPA: 3-isopropylmalate dehydrogenase [Candidatus Nesterenkonia stercoripullorum]|uniref:3-isopropylmalate dehydrogenase n=1 Tax=Candidatus Nesterenkonia stercoripullorum TaxID=2838701 RepID=A0A9D2A8B0_9MICC|nr:3-isopropylmalate dehydrogenase [Candidatus Nesterenkonia stercoripullorum]